VFGFGGGVGWGRNGSGAGAAGKGFGGGCIAPNFAIGVTVAFAGGSGDYAGGLGLGARYWPAKRVVLDVAPLWTGGSSGDGVGLTAGVGYALIHGRTIDLVLQGLGITNVAGELTGGISLGIDVNNGR
jgi:hypothetical protein